MASAVTFWTSILSSLRWLAFSLIALFVIAFCRFVKREESLHSGSPCPTPRAHPHRSYSFGRSIWTYPHSSPIKSYRVKSRKTLGFIAQGLGMREGSLFHGVLTVVGFDILRFDFAHLIQDVEVRKTLLFLFFGIKASASGDEFARNDIFL